MAQNTTLPFPSSAKARKRRKLLIVAAVVVLAVVFLTYMTVKGASSYYPTTTQLVENSQKELGKEVRVVGKVLPGSLARGADGLDMRFTIFDPQTDVRVPASYKGVLPDQFEAPHADVILQGIYNSDGSVTASTVSTKCASKYVPAS